MSKLSGRALLRCALRLRGAMQIPVDVIAVGYDRIRRERQSAPQQPVADRRRQVAEPQTEPLRSSRTGEKEDAHAAPGRASADGSVDSSHG